MKPSVDELLFTAASNFPEATSRRAFLEFACRGDLAQLQRVEELLEVEGAAEDYFEIHAGSKRPAQVRADGEVEDTAAGTYIGPYRLIDRLGSGGCGVVYLAEQHEPVRRKVALKIIRLGMDTESVITRFNMERESLALMDHPNIARVLDAGATASGRPYFVMELVDGEKITDFCDGQRLGIRERLELFISVCEAIQHAHQKGVIHRDIKPSNVLVRPHGGRPVPKVIDFGIAKATTRGSDADATVTRDGQFIGTPAYMSPEQAEGGADIDTRTDIYSLGALLCELLTGSPPVRLEHLQDRSIEEIRGILRADETGAPSTLLRQTEKSARGEIASKRAVDPERLPALLAGDLDWIVLKAIDKERHRRYETANGLAMDVERYLNEEPVLARPPSRRYLLTKLVRRNRLTFAAVGIALFGLLAGLGTSTWLFFREREAREAQARLRAVAEHARANEERLRKDAVAADSVARAAVLLRYKDVESADALLDALTVETVPRSLEASNTLTAVAKWNLTKGRWEEAAERFNLVAHVLTSVDMRDSSQISFDFLPAATAVSTWGRPDEYQQLRNLAIERFGTSTNPVVAEQAVKAVLLEPADAATLAKVVPLAKVVEDSLVGPRREKDPLNVSWRQFSLALMAYRQGEYEEAGDWAQKSLTTTSKSVTRVALAQILGAMVDLREGRTAEAQMAITRIRHQVDQWAAAPFEIHNPDGTLWSNWGTARILLVEAERMANSL